MIFQHIVERAINSHRTGGGIVCHCASHRAAKGFVHFIDSAHVNALAVIRLDFLHQVPVPIVNELGRLSAHRDRDQSVFCIEGLSVRQASFDLGLSGGESKLRSAHLCHFQAFAR